MDCRHVLILAATCFLGCTEKGAVQLVGRAELPADTFVDGPTSGQFIEPANGRVPPFQGSQPVQGFSALLVEDDGSFLALADNGFGAQENSSDYVLRVFRLRPDFETDAGGSGQVQWQPEFELSDPDSMIPWPIVADGVTYPDSDILVDSVIARRRLLTGGDFDPESFRRVSDGTFYFGDEFGPFLLHTDDSGRLLEPPITLPGVWSPQHPELGDRDPNLPRSAGFEGMALSGDGRYLYPMLEKPLSTETESGLLRIFKFDLQSGRYSSSGPDEAAFLYRLSPEATYATEFVHLQGDRYLAIERDAGQGPTAAFKRVFELDLGDIDETGILKKRSVIDLLEIADPSRLSLDGGARFRFPYETTEALAVMDDGSVVIVNDNNYPFGQGRYWEEGEPDGNEVIRLRMVDGG